MSKTKQMYEQWYQEYMGTNWDEYWETQPPPFIEDGPDCYHDWDEYVGFTETYLYCANCGVKEDDV